MSARRVLVGVPDPEVQRQVAALMGEAGGLEVAATAGHTDDVAEALRRMELDVVVLDEELGPLPVLELTRQLGAQHPTVGFLLLARDVTPDLLRQALRSGVRDVLGMPLTVENLREAIEGAASFSQAVRDQLDDDSLSQVAERIGGRIVAVAGAKGGVGTSTVAMRLGLAAALADPDRPTCLVELDLQAGDLRALMEISSRRSVADLVAVADEVTVRSLDDTLYVHPSGLRILPAPEDGEDGEDVTGAATRQIMAALKFQYDLVICDVGSVLTEAGAVAVELANDVVVVTTPDVPALRAANRLVALWGRLRIEPPSARVVLNRVTKDSEIQPDFAGKVLRLPLCDTRLPADFKALESALNTGDPDRLEDGQLTKAYAGLAEELGVVQRAQRRRRLRLRSSAQAAEAGSVSVEVMGLTGVIVVLLLGIWQIVLVGYTYELAGASARAASRGHAVGEPRREIVRLAKAPLPGGWKPGMGIKRESDGVEVTLRVPIIIPGVDSKLTVSDRKRTVIEGNPLPSSYLPPDDDDDEEPAQ